MFPLVWMTSTSFKTDPEIFETPPRFFPKGLPTLYPYKILFQMTNFEYYLINSFILSFLSSAIGVALATCGVYSMSRFHIMGGNLALFIIMFTYMLPRSLIIIPFYSLGRNLHLIDSRAYLMFLYVLVGFPFAVWLLRSYIETIPVAMEEAAMVDGSTRFQAFYRVVVPQAVPGMIATFVFIFVNTWNELIFALVIISTDTKKTLTVGLSNLVSDTAVYSWALLSAGGVLATLPIIVIFFLMQKKFMSGFKLGGLKG
jgi:ABC-type glycerol-3-phosphate transport system permease component